MTNASQVFQQLRRTSTVDPVRVKTAQHLINLHKLKQELSAYDVRGLCKAAAVNTGYDLRIKYAALKTQQLIETRALLSLLSPGLRAAKYEGR